MSTFKIPNREKQIIQSNVGDYRGNVWSTFNMDLDSSPGTLKVAPRMKRVLGDTEIGDGLPQALQVHDGEYYAVTSDTVHTCDTDSDPRTTANWSEILTLSSEADLTSDVTSFNGFLLLSRGTDITSWVSSTTTRDDDWWTNTISGTALTDNYTHTLEVLRTGNDTLFVTDKNNVRYYNTSAGHTTITLESLFVAHTLSPGLDRMWVGTYTEVENNSYMYEIRVGDSIANAAYPVDGRAVLSSFIYKNTPFVITERGYIQVFNGAGFETIAQFPWALESKVMEGARPGLVQDTSSSRAIHPKGAKVSGKYCYIYVNTADEYSGTGELLDERSPSGVWTLDLETYSLTHRQSLTTESTDYGWSKVTRSGPLLVTNTPETRLMVLSELDAVEEGLWVEDTAANQGYFTTLRHESETVADSFEAFYVKSDTLDTDEQIQVKYRETVSTNMPYTVDDVTWLNSTQFNTTDALTDVAVGHEIEILGGYRSGNVAHITAIEGTTTKTVTVDEEIGSLNEMSDIRVDNWLKLDETYVEDEGEYKRFGVPGTATFRQYKVVARGDVEIREVISKSNSKHEL